VSTSQKPSSSRRRDIASVEELGRVDSRKGVSVYTSVENVPEDEYLSDATGGSRRPITDATGGSRRPITDATGGAAGAGHNISETPESGTSGSRTKVSSSRISLDSRVSGRNASRVAQVTQDSEAVRSLAVTPNATTKDLINNLINMGIEGASLRETYAKFWDAVETLRSENPSAAAVFDEAMKTGGKVRVEVDDRHATSSKAPKASEPIALRISTPKPPSDSSSRTSGKRPSEKTKSKARAPSPDPSGGDSSDSSNKTRPPKENRRTPSDTRRSRAPAPDPPGDSSSEEDDPKPPKPSKIKPRAKDRRKSYGEAVFLYEEDPSEPDDHNINQDFSNSTIALMLRSDRGAQAFLTAKDRKNIDSIPHMVVEFILKYRNISAVFYFIKAHLVRLQVTWYAMVNYLTQEWRVAICHALSSRGKKPIVYGIPYLMTLTNIQLIRAIALVIMPTSPQEFMRLLSESKSTTARPNPARFLSHHAVYDYNISEFQRGLDEYSILCVGNTHWESTRDRDLFNDDGKPA
jgi:hypothetical protein